MKNKTLVFTLLLITMILVLVYYYYNTKKMKVNVFFQNNGQYTFSPDSKHYIEKILGDSIGNIEIFSESYDLSFAFEDEKYRGASFDFAIVNTIPFFKEKRLYENYEILKSLSSRPSEECFIEARLVTSPNSSIKELKQLNGKKIAITPPAKKVLLMFLPDLKKNQVVFDTVYLNKRFAWIDANLKNKNIDAGMSFSFFQQNSKIQEGELEPTNIFAKFKSLARTNLKVPCQILIAKKSLSNEVKSKFTQNLNTSAKTAESLEEFNSTIKIASIYSVSPEETVRLKEIIDNLSELDVEDFSKNFE